ncbi:MAG: nitrogenase [Erysipelotrichaceae bacterium]|nr:nitrogenase [Erysipelotrichaceae bacterium]
MAEFKKISDISYEYNADIGLAYSSPCRGIWNIVHIGAQIPGCHQIYVCPTSCLRGVVLTTAEMNAMDRLSTITVGEDNILEGTMEETLQQGTEKIIASLPERPRMIMIFISCIHHFLAANYQRVYQNLRKEYPDIDFVDAYMDPIMRRKTPAVPSLTRQTYRILQPAPHDLKQINYVGNWFPMKAYSDMTCHLKKQGIAIRDLAEAESYDAFKEMQNSCCNLTFHKYSSLAGKDMEIRLHQKWIPIAMSYDYDVIDADIDKVCDELNIAHVSEEEKQAKKNQTEQCIREVLTEVGKTPISIDDTAVDEPLSLALFLIRHGFAVESVFIESFTEKEEVFQKLQEIAPDLKIYSADNWNMRIMDRKHAGKIIGIGQKAAYFNNTDHFVNMIESAGMYGYLGIQHLFQLIESADKTSSDMPHLIQHKGWGCCAK